MPIVFKNTESYTLSPVQFSSESELQEILAENPSLLMDENDPEFALVSREVSLGNSGLLDILLVDKEGRPIAVEVKLEKNAEVRRQVVGQVFDYVSALSLYTVDELDNLVGGKLDLVLGELVNRNDEADFKRHWKQLGANLRAGEVRVIVAVDSAPEDLVRIIRFINEHSNLDVRLVSIQKYLSPNHEVILVPTLLVFGGGMQISKASKAIRPEFEQVISRYNAIADPGFTARGKGRMYRLIYPDSWPWEFHYEFFDCGDKISIEIHLEGENVRSLGPFLQSFEPQIKMLFPTADVTWDAAHSRHRGGITARPYAGWRYLGSRTIPRPGKAV
ncbi:MAG: DUF91 domain-containing protein [Syntrophomonadaceae bacterium]|jgi:hypothetical protein|nr:DUF91 domain-containing protein [Syntrophomonadaceae bacterium]